MTTNAKLEMDDNWKTGSECPDTASYCCNMHPYVEKFVHQGENFPKCDQKGLPHNTVWNKIIK